ncbi:MAG: hypothetical protein ABI212_15155 [Burkholderiaceae bacterium]
MRGWFSVIGLVLVLAVLGAIANRQLSSLRASPTLGVSAPGTSLPVISSPAANLPAQYQQALDAALQTARPLQGDAK